MALTKFKAQYPELCETLLHIKVGGRFGHAYLFVGDDGDLAGRLARGWLQAFACRQPLPDGEACEDCDRCRQFEAGSYPGLQILEPKSRMRQILVDDVREFERQLHLTASPKAFKFGLIHEADRLNEQAQNALLKTLEEPPVRTLIVLATSHPRALLPTIRSRCQRVSLLQNRRSYDFAIQCGLFPILAGMKRNAGATAALRCARQMLELFAGLKEQARASTETSEEEESPEEAAEQTPQIRKKLAEVKEARLAAEYRRLRSQLTEAIHCWYLQQSLLSQGIAVEDLPHPELLAAACQGGEAANQAGDAEDCELAVAAAAGLARQTSGNMDERLAIQAFCLEVCEKAATP